MAGSKTDPPYSARTLSHSPAGELAGFGTAQTIVDDELALDDLNRDLLDGQSTGDLVSLASERVVEHIVVVIGRDGLVTDTRSSCVLGPARFSEHTVGEFLDRSGQFNHLLQDRYSWVVKIRYGAPARMFRVES